MDRIIDQQAVRGLGDAGIAANGSAGRSIGSDELPPTRAARPARSRGVFFFRHGLPRLLFHRVAAAVCIAVAVVCLAAAALPRLLGAQIMNLNPGPGLVAETTILPPGLAPKR